MNKTTPTLISAAMLAVTVISLVFGLVAARKQRAAEAAADELRLQVDELQQKKSKPLRVAPAASLAAVSSSVDTNVIAELEAELAALRAQLAKAQENRGRDERESWEDRMARMKEEDPEGFAQMIKERAERREQMRYNLAERTANFMELDTQFMSDTEFENHEILVQKMGEIWDLTEQMQDPEMQPDRETMRELFGLVREARPLMDTERTTMFRQLASDLGMEGEEASAFSGYVEGIIETTTIQMPRGGRGGGRGGR